LRVGGISIFRLVGEIAEQWEQLGRLALMQQLGVLPTPGQGTPQAQPGYPATPVGCGLTSSG
jgi:hypothetical protein